MHVPYFIILLCLMPDDFTPQGESAATQWVKFENCAHSLSFLFFKLFLIKVKFEF